MNQGYNLWGARGSVFLMQTSVYEGVSGIQFVGSKEKCVLNANKCLYEGVSGVQFLGEQGEVCSNANKCL